MSIPSIPNRRPCGRRRSVLLAMALVLSVVAALPPALAAEPDSSTAESASETITASDAIQARIFNGVPASIADLPAVVLIINQSDGGSCTGTIIADRWVLTAAHCFDQSFTETTANAPEILVLAGRDQWSSNAADWPESHVADRGIHHPSWNPNNNVAAHDIALLRLATTTSFPPMALTGAGAPDHVGQPATVAGWGLTQNNPAIDTDVLRRATVDVRPHSDCEGQWGGQYDRNWLVCAGGGPAGSDACAGDSGGPLLLESGGTQTLIGVVNAGDDCTPASQLNGIYTGVAAYRTWIDQTIGTTTGDVISHPDTNWSSTATTYRGQHGQRVSYACPAGGTATSVWGTDIYTDDSSVCTAAVHVGLITPASGGTVVIEIRPGQASYQGSERNGITSRNWGSWSGSFVVVDASVTPPGNGEQGLGPEGDCASAQPLPSGVQQGLQVGFESGSLDGRWTIGEVTDEIRVVGSEQIGVPGQDAWARTATPLEGSRMLRLGAAYDNDNQRQDVGPNEVCQDFRVVNAVERFAFNVFTFDYTGYDEFRYDLTLQDAGGDTIATYSQGAFGDTGDTRLKTSGWRQVQLDLSGFQGQTLRLTVAAGGTRDTRYGFWTYLDSATGGDVVVPQPDNVVTERPANASVWVNPSTGLFTVSVVAGRTPGDLNLAMPVSCEVGEVTQARFAFNNIIYPAEVVGGIAYGTIPGSAIAQGASFTPRNVNLLVDCSDGSTTSTVIGSIVLYDPSGFLTDAVTGAPVVDAEVTLYRVPGWQPRTQPGDTRADTCESHLSKPAGAAWSQPAPTHLGVPEPAASQRISPNVNPFLSDDSGYYGWDVAEGCWYVSVEAEGYQPLTSPVVGVPPEVTDLDLALTPTSSAPFVDVPAGFVHEPGILAVAAAGITTGCAPGRYCPADPVTRAQMATFLMRTLNLPDPGGTPFMDVPAGFVHAPGIRAVEQAGITTGCAPGRYCPADPVTRAQMATFLMRAADLPPGPLPTPFADVPTGFVHAPAISAVAQVGITGGCAPGRYCPADPVTRAQMATFLYRAFLDGAVG